ncbi:hypothetical protein DFH08DRAFT_695433 [Mycena albidolilacea]|uniref:DNA primase n=1 Tax=Mycena albidolilacea TaxID=1033008 RepID=A0AAD7EUL9_9AGAR|nr:hypothetical protein DFH08DRAFT_695433 [Mycena albidolilacea]
MSDEISREILKVFYGRLYPYSTSSTMNPSRATSFSNALNVPHDVMTVIIRYNSFNDYDEFKKQVCKLAATCFDIGPPRDRKTARKGMFNPTHRELVLNIDMTDDDPVRTCCSDADICKRCWSFISAAVRVLDTAVRDQFGYTHLLWVYSSRYGIHLWVSDKEVMALTDDQRKAIVSWLTVVSKDKTKKLNVRFGSRTLPASLQTSLDHLAVIFTELILHNQDVFASDKGFEALLKRIPDARVVDSLETQWRSSSSSSFEKWTDSEAEIKHYAKGTFQRVCSLSFSAGLNRNPVSDCDNG